MLSWGGVRGMPIRADGLWNVVYCCACIKCRPSGHPDCGPLESRRVVTDCGHARQFLSKCRPQELEIAGFLNAGPGVSLNIAPRYRTAAPSLSQDISHNLWLGSVFAMPLREYSVTL